MSLAVACLTLGCLVGGFGVLVAIVCRLAPRIEATDD